MLTMIGIRSKYSTRKNVGMTNKKKLMIQTIGEIQMIDG